MSQPGQASHQVSFIVVGRCVPGTRKGFDFLEHPILQIAFYNIKMHFLQALFPEKSKYKFDFFGHCIWDAACQIRKFQGYIRYLVGPLVFCTLAFSKTIVFITPGSSPYRATAGRPRGDVGVVAASLEAVKGLGRTCLLRLALGGLDSSWACCGSQCSGSHRGAGGVGVP